jgi:hypothetical protein
MIAGIGLGIRLGIPSVIGLCPKYKRIQQVVITLYLPLTMTENLLPAFNGQLDLRIAYNWNQSEVSFPDMRLIYTNLTRSMIFSKMSSIIMPVMVYPRKEGLSWQTSNSISYGSGKN